MLPYAGLVDRTSGGSGGDTTYGYFWIGYGGPGEFSKLLYVYDAFVDSESNSYKKFGFSVQCKINRTDTTQRDKFISSPYNFLYSGYYYYGGGVGGQGSSGYWWSRSSYTTAGQAYYFSLNTNGAVGPQYYYGVGYGFAVRCVGE